MRRLILAACALLLALGVLQGSIVSAARTPTPTPTARPTATATATATAIPTPSATPTPIVGSGTIGPGGGDTGCPADSIHVITIFGQPVCLDSGGLLSAIGTAMTSLVQAKTAALFASAGGAVLSALAGTEDMTDAGKWGALLAIQAQAIDMERDAFAVVLGLSILWIIWPLFFGDARQGVSLFWHAVFAEAAINGLTPLLHLAALLAGGIGERLVGPGLGVAALRVALAGVTDPLVFGVGGVLLAIAGIERSIALYAQMFLFVVAPLMILLLVFPPTRRHGAQWVAAYINLLLLGPAFGLMIRLFLIGVVAQGGGGIPAVAGFLAIDLVPALLGTLTVLEIRGIGHAFAGRAANVTQSAALPTNLTAG